MVQLPSADSVPEPQREPDFATGPDWNELSRRITRPQLDALVVAWALRALVGADEAPIPWRALGERTGFPVCRLSDAINELRRVRAVVVGGHGVTVRFCATPSAITWFYEQRARREKGGRA